MCGVLTLENVIEKILGMDIEDEKDLENSQTFKLRGLLQTTESHVNKENRASRSVHGLTKA
jgi:Mg2+/Co2+ transporter CorC